MERRMLERYVVYGPQDRAQREDTCMLRVAIVAPCGMEMHSQKLERCI